MDALSVLQPWAWLIVNGYKDVENRTWSTKKRGKILIHAGKGFDDAGYETVKKHFPEIPMPEKKAFESGGVVGEATIADCVASSLSPWYAGDFAFVLTDARPLPFKPVQGKLGFFKVDY